MQRRLLLQAATAAGLTLQFSGTFAAPRRIVSVGGALTETAYALGAQAELVGVDTTSLFPAAARALPSVGYARQLSAEGVLSLAPSLVVASDEAGPATVLRQLEAAKVPVHLLASAHSIEGTAARTEKLGALLGRADAGRALAQQIRQDAAAARDRATAQHRAAPPRVLFVLAHSMSQLRVAGEGTGADAMIRLAGARNALAGVEGYKPLNAEAALAAAPEWILTTDQGLEAAGGVEGLLKAPGLANTTAGRARRVASMDALLLLGFGPRLPAAIQALAQGLTVR
ncbi:MAG: heme/hemin ABC transporter substrate-binding protein [Pseudomonadota bacterium]